MYKRLKFTMSNPVDPQMRYYTKSNLALPLGPWVGPSDPMPGVCCNRLDIKVRTTEQPRVYNTCQWQNGALRRTYGADLFCSEPTPLRKQCLYHHGCSGCNMHTDLH
jgi:hypothetical protein